MKTHIEFSMQFCINDNCSEQQKQLADLCFPSASVLEPTENLKGRAAGAGKVLESDSWKHST